jgi:F-type H+-transporting ATPase subunit beta
MSQFKGKISQIIGPVIDVSFENADKLPNLLEAIEIIKADGTKVVLECQKHLEKTVLELLQWIQLMV